MKLLFFLSHKQSVSDLYLPNMSPKQYVDSTGCLYHLSAFSCVKIAFINQKDGVKFLLTVIDKPQENVKLCVPFCPRSKTGVIFLPLHMVSVSLLGQLQTQ